MTFLLQSDPLIPLPLPISFFDPVLSYSDHLEWRNNHQQTWEYNTSYLERLDDSEKSTLVRYHTFSRKTPPKRSFWETVCDTALYLTKAPPLLFFTLSLAAPHVLENKIRAKLISPSQIVHTTAPNQTKVTHFLCRQAHKLLSVNAELFDCLRPFNLLRQTRQTVVVSRRH